MAWRLPPARFHRQRIPSTPKDQRKREKRQWRIPGGQRNWRRLSLLNRSLPGFTAVAYFAAGFAARADLAGIERTVRSEGVVDAADEVEIGVSEKKRHELGFFHADAVLAGERAADVQAI